MLLQWTRFSRDERMLLAHGAFWVLAAHAVLRTPGRSFPEKRARLDALAQRLPKPPACSLQQAAWVVTAAARRVPRTVCLPWALALHGLLTQAGIASELRIGVAADGGSLIKAHAWVQCQGRDLSWNESIDDYRVLATKLDGEVERSSPP